MSTDGQIAQAAAQVAASSATAAAAALEQAVNVALGGSGMDAEAVRAVMATTLVEGENVTIEVDNVANTITLSSTGGGGGGGGGEGGLSEEQVRDLVASVITQGTNVTVVKDDVGNTVTISATDTNTTDPEVVRDVMAAALVAGTNVSLLVNDAGDTITISATDTNTTDPEVVRDTMAAALVAGTNVTITPNDAGDTITISATGGGGGGATTLNDLSDVDTTGVGDGYVPYYDLATSSWKVQPGGGAVGAWENNKTVTYTPPPWTEFNLQSSGSIPVPTTKSTLPQITFTVTSAMLTVASDAAAASPLGHTSMLVLNVPVSHQATSGTAMTQNYEFRKNGITLNSGSDGGHANTERGSLLVACPIEVGDVIELWVWVSGTGAGASVIDFWMRGGGPTNIGKNSPPGGGRYMYRDLSITATTAIQVWATTVSFAGTPVALPNSGEYRLYEGTTATTAVGVGRTYIPDTSVGLIRNQGFDNVYPIIADTTGIYYVLGSNVLAVSVDRLAIPALPA